MVTAQERETQLGQDAAERFRRLRGAVIHRRTLRGIYGEREVTVWPYALGWREAEPYLLGLVVTNTPAGKPLPLRVEWFPVRALSNIVVSAGYWIAAEVDFVQLLRFLDDVEAVNPSLLDQSPSGRRMERAPTA